MEKKKSWRAVYALRCLVESWFLDCEDLVLLLRNTVKPWSCLVIVGVSAVVLEDREAMH
jgi:hypothetical protein